MKRVLTRVVIKRIHAAVDAIFDKAKVRFLGRPPRDKRIVVGFSPRVSIPSLFEAASFEERARADKELLDGLLDIAEGFVESIRERTKAHTVKSVEAWLAQAHASGVSTDVDTVLGGELAEVFGKATEGMAAIMDTEASHARNLGLLDGIVKVNAANAIDDPVVYFVVVRDNVLCGECRRLHLLDDGVTPRLWRLSELGRGYHKKGDPTPKVGGLHPHCRCTLVTLLPGYGFDKKGSVDFKALDHDEFNRQRGARPEKLGKSRPEGIETWNLLSPMYADNASSHADAYGHDFGKYHEQARNARVTVAFPPHVAAGLAREGRFLNQWETHTSMGSYDPEGERTDWEANNLGIPRETHHHRRPIYGAVATQPIDFKTGPAPAYGDAFAMLKPHVHARTSVTPEDSSVTSLSQVVPFEHLPAALHMRGSDDYGYIEAQIHGGVNLAEDVESLHINPDVTYPEHVEKVVALGKKYGIPVYHHQLSEPMRRSSARYMLKYGEAQAVTKLLHDPAAQPAHAPAPGEPAAPESAGTRTSAPLPSGSTPPGARSDPAKGSPGPP